MRIESWMLPSWTLHYALTILAICFFVKVASFDKEKVVAYILFYDLRHIQSLSMLVTEYRGICEMGADVTLVLHTTYHEKRLLMHHLLEHTFCYRILDHLRIEISRHPQSTGIYLSEVHRRRLIQDFDKYDIFIYQEDDILLQASHIAAYLHETRKLQSLGEAIFNNFFIGFQRYRRTLLQINGSGYKSVLPEGEFLEETPFFDPICLEGHPYHRVISNPHQGFWILTREQLRMLENRCKFSSQSISETPDKRFVITSIHFSLHLFS